MVRDQIDQRVRIKLVCLTRAVATSKPRLSPQNNLYVYEQYTRLSGTYASACPCAGLRVMTKAIFAVVHSDIPSDA